MQGRGASGDRERHGRADVQRGGEREPQEPADGEYEDYPNYVDCTMLGRRAESVSRYLTKGTYVALTGRLHQNRWQNKDGQNRSKLEVTADNIHFESRRLDGDDYDQQQAEAQGDYEAQMYDEDIPF